MPIDVGTLVLWIVAYVVGFMVLSVGSLRSNNFRIALVVYIFAPGVWIAAEVTANDRRNAKVVAEAQAGEVANEQAFSRYCQDRQRRLFRTAHLGTNGIEGDRAVYVRFDSSFPAEKTHFNADVLAHRLQMNPARCAQTGLVALEGKYDGAFVNGQAYTPEIKRFDACTMSQGRIVPAAEARYELVLGETSRKDQVPWGGQWGRWMSRTSVRIVDRRDASTLAEDTLYFLRFESGVGGCPRAEEQLADLLEGAFGSPER